MINDGTVEEDPYLEALEPISGSYDAISCGIEGPPAMSILVQQIVTLPSNITSATLSWSDRIRNSVDDFDNNQGFGLLITFDFMADPEALFMITAPGDAPIQIGPNPRSIDLTEIAQSLEGQEPFIAFGVMANEGPFFVTVDDVSLNVNTLDDMAIDIKPGSDPNCFNNDGHGVIPVAILGSAGFDVTTIDAESVMLEGLAIKAVGKSNKLLAHYDDVNTDGYYDLVVQIEDTDQVFAEGDTIATVTGYLNDETYFQGFDTICIVP